MSDLKYGIDTIDIIIDSLKNTKEKLENNDLLSDDFYGNFEILLTIYASIEQVFGSNELDMFQKEYISTFINLLASKINNEQLKFSTMIDEGFYIIKTSVMQNNQTVDLFYINPYFKSIIPIEDRGVLIQEERLELLRNEENQVLSRIEQIQSAKLNPMEYAKDSLGLYTKSMFNKKGFEKGLNSDLNELQLYLVEVKRNISELEMDIELYKESIMEIELMKNRFLQYLQSNLNFQIIED